MATRWKVTKAVRASDLPAPSRLVMLVLADVAEVGTAEIPEKFTPSLTVLARETGLDRRTVVRHLEQLEDQGWVIRTRPSDEQMIRGERNRYRLSVPGIDASEETGSSDLGAQDHHLVSGDPRGRGTESPDLGAQDHQARGTVPPPKEEVRSPSDQSDLPPPADAEGPRRPAGRAINAGDVVGAYVDGAAAGGHPRPTERLRKRVGKEATQLLAEKGQNPDLVLQAGFDAGRVGWHDLSVQMQRSSADRRAARNGRDVRQLPDEAELKSGWEGLRS